MRAGDFPSLRGVITQGYETPHALVLILNIVESAEYARWRESYERGVDYYRANVRQLIEDMEHIEREADKRENAVSRFSPLAKSNNSSNLR